MPDKITAEDAPTLVAANITEDKLEADLCVKEDPKPAAPEIPPHHIEAVYNALRAGSDTQSAARVAGVPLEVAQAVAKEIAACCDKLGSAAPAACKAEAERAKIVEEPKGGGEVVIK